MRTPHRIGTATATATGLVAGLVALLPACGVYDAGPDRMQVFNDTSSDVVVSITDTDTSQVVEPGGGGFPTDGSPAITGRTCIGTGIVVAKPDGTVIADYKGPACGNTTIRVMKDGSVGANDGRTNRTSEPLPRIAPTTPAPTATPSS